jgi:hypothetical protein
MYIPPEDPWGSAEDYKAARDNAGPPDNVNQVIDVTAKVIGKRRSARDAAKNFLKNKSRSMKQSAAGQKVAEVAQNIGQSQFGQNIAGAAQNIGQSQFGQNVAQAVSGFPGGGLGLAGSLALAGGGAALGYAALQQRKKQAQEQQAAMMQSPAFAAASNIAAQMIRY